MKFQDIKPFNLPLGMFSFVVTTDDCTELEFNGLSKPPASISCHARLHSLREFRHPNLCSYIEIAHCKPDRIFLITECYTDISTCVTNPNTDSSWILSLFLDCMKGLAYMSDNNLVHSFLKPSHIMVDSKGYAKIAGYGIYSATDRGKDFNFPLADPSYSAPEVFLASPICVNFLNTGAPTFDLNIACDVWSVGLIFFQLIHGHIGKNPLLLDDFGDNKDVNPLLSIRLLLKGLRQCENGGLKTLSEFLNFQFFPIEKACSLRKLETICSTCLTFNAINRPRPHELIAKIEAFDAANCSRKMEIGLCKDTMQHSSATNGSDLSLERAVRFVYDRNVAEVYHYWLLAGGNLKSVWRTATNPSHVQSSMSANCRDPTVTSDESVLPRSRRLPHYVATSELTRRNTLKATKHWFSGDSTELYGPEIIRLPGQRLLSRLSRMSPSVLHPLLIVPQLLTLESEPDSRTPVSSSTSNTTISKGNNTEGVSGKAAVTDVFCATSTYKSWVSQPITVREADIEYQVYRIGLFTRILDGMPTTKKHLYLESRKDIPPFLRAKVWAALLGVHIGGDYRAEYVKALSSRRPPLSPANNGDQDPALPPCGHPCFADRPPSNDTETVTRAVNALVEEKVAGQVAVDLPRCHGYDGILSSPVGQFKLRRMLLATLLRQPGLIEYTQGMDSVAAVFLRLCYPDDVTAAACLHLFLKHHLSDFFSPSGLTESLTNVFNMILRLFVFHAPRLAARLIDLEVPLIGLTTGWVYTLFAHAMPLNRTELLWDFLIATPPVFVAFVYVSVLVQLDRQKNLETLSLESICASLSPFPDISIDECRADAIRWALVTPASLATWPGMPRYPYLPTSSEEPEQALPARQKTLYTHSFYQRLCTPNAWPEHLEVEMHSTSCERKPESESTLVPILDPKDAMEHLKRPDCFVLDVRDKIDFARAHVPGSVNRCQQRLTMLSTGDGYSDWEIIDPFTFDGSSASRMLPKFMSDLMNEEAWQRAVDARIRAQSLSEPRRNWSSLGGAPVNQSRSPGILIVLDYGEARTSGGELAQAITAAKVADWLIHQDVDRVCLVDGGAASVLPLLSYSW